MQVTVSPDQAYSRALCGRILLCIMTMILSSSDGRDRGKDHAACWKPFWLCVPAQEELANALHCSMTLRAAPRSSQAAISTLSGKDTIVRAGTGYGKTLAMVLVMLCKPKNLFITISPLKLLQHSHVNGLAFTRVSSSLYAHICT